MTTYKLTGQKKPEKGNDMADNENPAFVGTSETPCTALLTAYAETCRHIEELERIQAGSKHSVFTCEAKKRANSLIERILALVPNATLSGNGKQGGYA